MSQKRALKNRPDPRKPIDTPKPSVLPVVDEAPVEELTGSEKFIQSMAPHAATIGLVAVAFVLGIIAWGVWESTGFQNQAGKWNDFSQAQFIDRRTGDTDNLDTVAESFPDNKVGVMSALMSGDIQLKRGLTLLGGTSRQGFEKEKGLEAIKNAKTSFQLVIDADKSLKTPLIGQRAQYCLAYAEESLGEMDKAKEMYQKFVDESPEAALADSARRGLERCSDDKYATLYANFANYEEEVIGVAPGPSIPEKTTPGSFPAIDATEGVVPPKGDDTDTRMNADVIAEEKAAVEKAAAEKKLLLKKLLPRKPLLKKLPLRKPLLKKLPLKKLPLRRPLLRKPLPKKPLLRKPLPKKPLLRKPLPKKPLLRKPPPKKLPRTRHKPLPKRQKRLLRRQKKLLKKPRRLLRKPKKLPTMLRTMRKESSLERARPMRSKFQSVETKFDRVKLPAIGETAKILPTHHAQ